MRATELPQTDARVDALTRIREGRVAYNSRTGDYFTVPGDAAQETPAADTERVTRAARRTFSELRGAGLFITRVVVALPDNQVLLDLSAQGKRVLSAWEQARKTPVD